MNGTRIYFYTFFLVYLGMFFGAWGESKWERIPVIYMTMAIVFGVLFAVSIAYDAGRKRSERNANTTIPRR